MFDDMIKIIAGLSFLKFRSSALNMLLAPTKEKGLAAHAAIDGVMKLLLRELYALPIWINLHINLRCTFIHSS